MYSHDRAIQKSADDILGRKSFSEKLAETISKYDSKESLVIALNGDWGSGKTSVINMVKEECGQKYNKIHIVDFNPWFYTDKHNLIFKFFSQLLDALKINEKLKQNQELFEDIKKYAENFENVLSPISEKLSWLPKLLKNWSERKSKNLKEKLSSIEYQREQIREQFLKLKFKFLVIIDDMDRLSGEEVRDIFQLVKLVGDIPNIIYLLSFDRNVVCKVMDKFQMGKGEAYLEKIVQVPFELPPLSKQILDKYLLQKINTVIEGSSAEQNRWNELYRESLIFIFRSLRDINRYINVLSFDFALLKGEVNVIDFLGITTIKVFNPALYDLIRNNKNLFLKTSGQDRDSILTNMNETDYKGELNSLADSLQLSIPVKKILLELFPETSVAFADQYYSKSVPNSRELRLNQRICSEDCFETYFMLTVPSEYLSNTQMNVILDFKDEDLLKSKLAELNKEHKITYFMDRLIDYTHKVSLDRAKFIIKVLFDIADTFDDGNPVYGRYGIEFQIWAFTLEILKKMTNTNERFIFLYDVISNASQSLFQSVYEITHHDTQANRFGQKADSPESKLLVDKDLDKLEELGKEKIEKWANEEKLIYAKRLAYILERWKEWGGEKECKEFIEKCYKSVQWIIRLILSEMKRVSVQSYEGYEQSSHYKLYYEQIQKKYDVLRIYKELEKIGETELNQLTEEEREAVKLFNEHYEGKIEKRRGF